MNFDEIKAQAQGRWPGIFQALGIDVGNGKHGPCPVCGGTNRWRFDDKDGQGTWFCNQCEPKAGDGIALVMKVLDVDFKTAMKTIAPIVGQVEPCKSQPEKPVSPEILRELYKSSKPVRKGDPVYKYLKNRGLHSMPKTLRFTSQCWESDTKKEQMAMLATFQLADGEAVTIHRTYIDSEGNKLQIERPKKMMPTLKPMKGGAVRLYEPGEVLGIAEGIETAIACREAFKFPVWAALSSGLLADWQPPKDAKQIVICSDNDTNYAGQKAAFQLANRLSLAGLSVSVEIPDKAGTDFLDEINGR